MAWLVASMCHLKRSKSSCHRVPPDMVGRSIRIERR